MGEKMDDANQKNGNMYMDLLKASIRKKIELLNVILAITEQQEKLIALDQLEDSSFDRTMLQKEEQISNLLKVDEGFNQLYLHIKDELAKNRNEYKADIEELQQLIKEMTDLSVMIEALEKRNKSRMESYFTGRRKDIKTRRLNNKSVSSYYKSMTKLNDNRSFFYDKKK